MNLPSTKPSLSDSPTPTPLNIFPFVKGECGNCGVKERWLLHNVVVRGVDRRICTSCVLRLHPSSFCPCCFEFYEHPVSITSSSSAHRFVSCVKCSSLSHIHCLSSPPPLPSPYLCPPCSKPNFTFFPVPEEIVEVNLAKVFVCASKIALASMKKQHTMSNVRCERAVKEASMARKRTKESIEQCFTIQRHKDSPELENTIKSVSKKEDLVGYGGVYPQSPNGPLNNKIGTNGIGSPAIMNKIGANGNDGRIGNNGGRFGASAFKASA
ncbi:unnamed protein product [Lathyrus oleraceus]|uniref:Uncharacterized protein n=1 Tax=Pisum sativum TaxID=3888 RepID=A0A9D4WDC0_PEA|nr:uncharacterized protein LOC127091456 [Pisum sativum]KAI5398740.1 hypothetical protein KIW84_064207 [Pisum sativum]